MKCYQCQFDGFHDANDDNVSIILTLTCNTNTTLCAECPSGVTITPDVGPFKPGDVLTCSANNGYDPTYMWTGTAANGATVSQTGSSYTLPGGLFDLTCTATVSELTTCTGTASYSVDGNANPDPDGKYQILLNTHVTLLMLATL